VEFRVTAILERVRGDGPPVLPVSVLTDPRLSRPPRLTADDDRLRALTATLAGHRETGLDLADRICAEAHTAITYEYGMTTVETTAAEALAGPGRHPRLGRGYRPQWW
jgi:transglutaminase-like putative cysteine protease